MIPIRPVAGRTVLCLLVLAGLSLACNKDQEKVRQAVALLESVPPSDEAALDAAYGEARTLAILVKDDATRGRLLVDLESRYQQRKKPFEEARLAAAEEERRRQELEQAQRLAEIELERKRREMELEQKRERDARAAVQRQAAFAAAARESRVIEGIEAIEVATRPSLAIEDSKVLVLRNIKPYSFDFYLKCYTRGGSSKTMFVSMPALDSAEVGFLEGWDGNFVSDERCEALHDGDVVWSIRIR